MKKTVLVFGLIAGCIVSLMMALSMGKCYSETDFSKGLWIGYTSMIVAFSFVFVGIKSFRDKHNEGSITFKKAFTIGLWITLIASSIYVIVWLIDYYCFMPDFMDRYSAHMIEQAKSSGASQTELDSQIAEMAKYKEWYKNPVLVVLMTYAEILPVGLIITLISALILKKKTIDPLGENA